MARYTFHQRSYYNDRLYEKGEQIDLPDTIKPGPHMEPVDDAARAAMVRDRMSFTGEVPDVLAGLMPLYEKALSEHGAGALSPEALAKAFEFALNRVFNKGADEAAAKAELDALVEARVAEELEKLKTAAAAAKGGKKQD